MRASLLISPPFPPPSLFLFNNNQPKVNFDAERFVDYIIRADNYQQSIKTKLAQAGVKGRPSSAPLPWFDLQGSPLDFDLNKALRGKAVNADTLEEIGQQVCWLVLWVGLGWVVFALAAGMTSQRTAALQQHVWGNTWRSHTWHSTTHQTCAMGSCQSA